MCRRCRAANAGALRLSRTSVWSSLANRPAAYDMLVLITDGVPSLRYEAAGLGAEADRVKALGVRVVGIGVTTAVDAQALREIVSEPPESNYYALDDFDQLAAVIESLLTCVTQVPEPRTSTTTTTAAATTTTSSGSTSTTTSGTTTSTTSGTSTSTTSGTGTTTSSPSSTTPTSTTTTTSGSVMLVPSPTPVTLVVIHQLAYHLPPDVRFHDHRRLL